MINLSRLPQIIQDIMFAILVIRVVRSAWYPHGPSLHCAMRTVRLYINGCCYYGEYAPVNYFYMGILYIRKVVHVYVACC